MEKCKVFASLILLLGLITLFILPIIVGVMLWFFLSPQDFWQRLATFILVVIIVVMLYVAEITLLVAILD